VFITRNFDGLIVFLLLTGVFLSTSIQSSLTLRPDVPPQFLTPQPGSAALSATDVKIAKAYWDCARTAIEHKYALSNDLPFPLDPPPEFTVATTDLGPHANDQAIREHYWKKLRDVWYLNSTWKTVYQIDVSWITTPVNSFAEWLQGYVEWFAKPHT
jgi:hypothetical protein